jgi:hypothetical protein
MLSLKLVQDGDISGRVPLVIDENRADEGGIVLVSRRLMCIVSNENMKSRHIIEVAVDSWIVIVFAKLFRVCKLKYFKSMQNSRH